MNAKYRSYFDYANSEWVLVDESKSSIRPIFIGRYKTRKQVFERIERG